MTEPETRHIAGPTFPRKDFYCTQCKHCLAKTPEGEPEVHIENCTGKSRTLTPYEIGETLARQGRGISDLWGAVGRDEDMPEAQRGYESAPKETKG